MTSELAAAAAEIAAKEAVTTPDKDAVESIQYAMLLAMFVRYVL